MRPSSLRVPVPALLVLLGLLAIPHRAIAHPLDLIAIRVQHEAGGTVRQAVRVNPQTLLLLAPVVADARALDDAALRAGLPAIEAGLWDDLPLTSDGVPCARGRTTARLLAGPLIELTTDFSCPPGALRQDYRLLSVLPEGSHVALELARGEGPPVQRFASAEAPSITLPGASGDDPIDAPASTRGFGGWVSLGVQHILEGFDHLAFLAALLLLGGGVRRILLLVTGFTLAHSITLGATALGWVRLGPAFATWVEIAIAASIVIMAALNLKGGEGDHRLWLTLGFGLLHGFGFAGVLAGYGLGEPAWRSLLGFNLGVELGQAAVIVVTVPLLAWLKARPQAGRYVVPVGSLLLLMLGLWWSVERLVPATVLQGAPLG